MPRYGIDATPTLGRRTGIGRLVEELAAGLARRLRDDEELVLCARTFRLNSLFGVSHAPLRRGRPQGTRWRRVAVPSSLLAAAGRLAAPLELDLPLGRFDVFHGTAAALPATRRAKRVVTIHDLGPLRRPGDVPRRFAARFTATLRDAVRRADRIVAVSEFTAGEIVELLGIPAERVRVVRPGVSPRFAERGDPDEDAAVAARRGLRPPYLLVVGTTNPRKNLVRLVEAFARARRAADLPHRLAIVGDRGFAHDALVEAIARTGLTKHVVSCGWVAEEDLPSLYRAADAVAFPSLYEGFGLPALEAMATGRPLLAARAASLPEVVGDAALLADPESVEDLARGLIQVLTDEPLRKRLRSKGRFRAASFRWDAFVAEHLAIYRDLAGGG